MAKKKKKPADDDLPKKKKGKKSIDEDALEDEVEDVDLADEDDDQPAKAKKDGPKDDAYTGLLAIAMIAFIAVAVLWYLDHEHHASQTLSNPRLTIPGLGAFSQGESGAGMPNPGN